MSIKTKFSPLGYLFPKTPQVNLTINVNISVDNIYLNGVSIAQNTNTVTIPVNQGLICNVKVEEQDYGTVNLEQFICYSNTTKDVYMSTETTETLYLSINSGEEAEFIIPLNQYRPVAYNWNIDWGDGIIETHSGTGTFNTGIVHQYSNKNTLYTIKIKRNEQTNYDEWLLAFGFDDETTNVYGPSSQTNKDKVLLVDGKLDEHMFFSIMNQQGQGYILNPVRNNVCAYMFSGCSNLKLGNSFTLPNHNVVKQVGNNFCRGMFKNCTSLDDLKNMNLDISFHNCGDYCFAEMFMNDVNLSNISKLSLDMYYDDNDDDYYGGIQGCGTYFASQMFRNCYAIEDLKLFNLPSSLGLQNISNFTCSEMFRNCNHLININNLQFSTHITNAPQQGFALRMFQDCSLLETIEGLLLPNITSINNNIISDRTGTTYGYFESAFENCTKLKTGLVTFLSYWTNATEFMINYHWNDYLVIPYTQFTIPVQFKTFYKMFKNCISIEENLTPSIKPLSFTPERTISTDWDSQDEIERQTFRNCPSTVIATLNDGWK